MRTMFVALALVPMLLAGCAKPVAVDEHPLAVTPPTADTPSPTPTTPSAPASPAPSPATPPTAPTPASVPHTTTLSGTWHADESVAAPTPAKVPPNVPPDANTSSTGVSEGEKVPKLHVAEGSPAKARLVATWSASTPAAATIRLNLTSDGTTILSGKGTSPLALDVPSALVNVGDFGIVILPDAPGAFKDQDVAVTWTLDYA